MALMKAVALFACLLPLVTFSQELPRFQESEGIVIIEVESSTDYGSWKLDTAKTGYTGSGYLIYTGPNLFNSPGMSRLAFEIAIEKIGKYRFQWHSLIAVGESNTEHNDSWLRFKDASDFYGQKNEEKVYPKGVGKSPNPEGSSANGWLKIYQNYRDGWTWQTRTSDRDPHDIFVEFDTTGIYTLEISGRSNGHAINRLALYHSEVSSSRALKLSQPESPQVQTTSYSGQEAPTRLAIRPTLATDYITVDLSDVLSADQFEIDIFNLTGSAQLSKESHPPVDSGRLMLAVSQLPSGLYLLCIHTNQRLYTGRFVKQ